jgi:type IV fimbrial biogenesis protein FimT
MRRVLMHAHRRQWGVSMIEVVVVVAITAAGAGMAVPYFRDYVTNARLLEGGNALLSEAMSAQSEAIKRNGPVRLVVEGGSVSVWDGANAAQPLRTRLIGQKLSATNTTITFGGSGALAPLGAANPARVGISMDGVTCSTALRCPALDVQVGGGMKLCKDKTLC